jgi:hypothetical protein
VIPDFILSFFTSKYCSKIHPVPNIFDLLKTLGFRFDELLVLSSDICFLIGVFAFGYIKKPFINLTFAKLAVGGPSKHMSPLGQLL